MLASYFSQNSDLYFQLLNGDKDLLRFAHKALRKEYFMSRFPTAGGAIFETRFCGFAFVLSNSAPLIIDPIRPNGRSNIRTCKPFKRNAKIEVPCQPRRRSLSNIQRLHFSRRKYLVASTNAIKSRYKVHPTQEVINSSRPCMEFFAGEGEPDIRERPFEELPGLEGFNDFYRRNGGMV